MHEGEKILKVNIENQMKAAYIDYSMSVIVSRALPDVRDGFKPVHRRVLYGMSDLGLLSNKPYKKSARIVGEVLGKYHPHGDSSVYDAMVRMAQDWSLRYPLVDGQGNFGSIDGDSPAAMRYTEARVKKITEEMLGDLNKDTVDFQLNFDDSLKEPTVLPTRIPNLLINGASGIAVGMATNMPPHNLSDVIDGCMAYVENHDVTVDDLMEYIKAPDFPTGCIIYGHEGVKQAYETGKGRVVMRAVANIEEENGRDRIIVTAIPYMVNKAEMIKKTADLVNDKKLEGISDIRDESDRNGLRIVYELKRDAVPNVVLNKLFQMTSLQSTFSVNNIALVKGRPQLLNLRDMIHHFIEFRHEVVIRRTQFELNEAEKKAHILEGLIIALDNIDEVIKLIRASKTTEEARVNLMERFELSELQARAILEMRLQKLTGLERDKLREEFEALMKLIIHLKEILENRDLRMNIIKEELQEVKDKYGDKRRSEIEYSAADFRIEDTIPDETVAITISHMSYIKRTSLAEYKVQSRGGVGSKGSSTRDEDFLEHLFIATNHNYMLFFTQKGKVFWLRVFEIPEGAKNTKGRAIQNMINIEPDDKVMAYISVQNITDADYINENFIILATKKGIIKKTSLEAYSRPRVNGINAITIREDDELLMASMTNGRNKVLMALRSGKAIQFSEEKVRPMGRNAAGVKGITLQHEKDEVIGMVCVDSNEYDILVVSEKGYGKRSSLDDYRETNRGGKGVKTLNVTEKTGDLIGILNVCNTDDLMIINKSGLAIRMPVKDLRITGRVAQGVKLINLKGKDEIAAITKINFQDTDEDDLIEDVEIEVIENAEIEIIEPKAENDESPEEANV
ncbi:MAG: DNA gyrase subunit A [Bacteroidales bacterium]|nr:DNA gyrase subunit A [Bacteroidales bacterium]